MACHFCMPCNRAQAQVMDQGASSCGWPTGGRGGGQLCSPACSLWCPLLMHTPPFPSHPLSFPPSPPPVNDCPPISAYIARPCPAPCLFLRPSVYISRLLATKMQHSTFRSSCRTSSGAAVFVRSRAPRLRNRHVVRVVASTDKEVCLIFLHLLLLICCCCLHAPSVSQCVLPPQTHCVWCPPSPPTT